jgi:Transposase DDE domain
MTKGSNSIFSIADCRAESVGFSRLLKSKHFKLQYFKKSLFTNTKQSIDVNKKYLAIIDGSEIRKPNSTKLEKLQGVMSLDKKVVNGYRSTGTVLVSEDNLNVHLFDQDVFSSKEENYKSDNDYAIKAIKQVVKLKKETKICVVFVLDRLYDTLEYMTLINSLKCEFIIRVKHKNRKVNYETNPIKTNLPLSKDLKERLLTPIVKTVDIGAFPIDKTKEFRQKIQKIKTKKGTFKNVTSVFRYYPVSIDDSTKESGSINGTAIEVTLKSGDARLNKKGGNLFKESMMLFTNKINLTEKEVIDCYFKYLQRFGIEQVYRFMKSTLNLEKFQIRDFESIKKLIAITFFTAAYFYLNKIEALEDPVLIGQIQSICSLGRGKGKIGLKYLKQGLETVMSHFYVEEWKKENNISDEELKEMMINMGFFGGLKSV